jgi:DNA-binding transcriptional LysR family regulator
MKEVHGMELKQLKYFVVLCEELHFTRAAEILNISQPALSQQIRILENEVGKPLFDRIGKTINVTEAGKLVLKHSENILSELEEIRNAVDGLNNLTKGTVSVGSIITLVTYMLPMVILRYNYIFPNITMTVSGLSSERIRERLIQGDLDLGILMLEENDKDLEYIPLFTEKFSLAVPANHELANEDFVKLEVLKETKNILLPNHYYTRTLLDEYCKSAGFGLKSYLEMETMEALVTMVENDAGVTVLADPYLKFKQSDKFKIIPLVSPTPIRKIGISYVKNKYLSTATRAFIDELIMYTEENNL